MTPAYERAVVDGRRATLGPRPAVVDVCPGRGPIAPRKHAAPVPDGDGSTDRDRPTGSLAADVEHLALRAEHDPVGGCVARCLGGGGRPVVSDDDRDPVAVGDRRVGGRLPHRLGGEIDERGGSQRATRAARRRWDRRRGRRASRGRHPLRARLRRGRRRRERSTHPPGASPRRCERRATGSPRRQPRLHRLHRDSRTSAAASSQRRVTVRKLSASRTSACSTKSSRDQRRGRGGGGAIADGPKMIGRETPRTGRRSDSGQLQERDSLSKPASYVGPSRPGPLRRPRCSGQRTVHRPPPLLLKVLEQGGGQGVHGVQQLFGSNYHDAQLITCDLGHIESTDGRQSRIQSCGDAVTICDIKPAADHGLILANESLRTR